MWTGIFCARKIIRNLIVAQLYHHPCSLGSCLQNSNRKIGIFLILGLFSDADSEMKEGSRGRWMMSREGEKVKQGTVVYEKFQKGDVGLILQENSGV